MSRKKRRKRIEKEAWVAHKKKYGNRCLCCGRPEPDVFLTKDHVIALSKGGSNKITNLQPLCSPCNVAKDNKTIDYRRWR